LSDRRRSFASRWLARRIPLIGVLAVVATLGGAQIASAAGTTSPNRTSSNGPTSLTACGGTVARDSGGGAAEPNLLDYQFHCWAEEANQTLGTSTATAENPIGGNVWAYTIYATRPDITQNTIDDYNATPYTTFPSPLTLDPFYTINPSAWPAAATAGSADTATGITCEQSAQLSAINCNAGLPTVTSGVTTNNGYIPESERVHGNLDLDQAYCKHLPNTKKIGRPAVRQAQLWLVVSDNTGAQDGPFRLTLTGRKCPKVGNFVTKKSIKAAAKASKKHGKKTTSKKGTKKSSKQAVKSAVKAEQATK